MQLLSNILLVRYRPFEKKGDNIAAIINEFLYTSSIIIYMIASDFTSEIEIKYQVGFALNGVLILTNFINLGVYLHEIFT